MRFVFQVHLLSPLASHGFQHKSLLTAPVKGLPHQVLWLVGFSCKILPSNTGCHLRANKAPTLLTALLATSCGKEAGVQDETRVAIIRARPFAGAS